MLVTFCELYCALVADMSTWHGLVCALLMECNIVIKHLLAFWELYLIETMTLTVYK